jgi:hypothetical protein
MKASSARLRFEMRTPLNWALVLGIFVPLAFVFAQFEWAWIADLIAIGLLFYLFFFILENRTIGFHCPHCLAYIATNIPWKCGFCPKVNQRTTEFPFVHRCEYCGAEPKAYRCHHCDEFKLIFLTKDELKLNYASCPNLMPAEDDSVRRMKEKEELMHEIEMVELAARLDSSNQRLDLGKRKAPAEEIEQSFTKNYARVMGSHEFARRQRTVNAEKFKDDPDMLKSVNDFIDDWLRNRV